MKFNKRKWLIFPLILVILVAGVILFKPKPPQPPLSITSIAELDHYLEKLTNSGFPPGLSLVVIKNDSIIYSKSFGWADRPRNILATPETVYHWWSITKVATAIAILQLEEQGKLSIDDPVINYLPFFQVKHPSEKNTQIKIRNLLNHGSGLPDPGYQIVRWIHHEGEPHWNQTELLKKVLPDYSTLEFEPGETMKYSNIGYMVLGSIIEKVTGLSYEDYIRHNILEPLKMEHTDFIYTKEMEPYEAAGSHPLFDLATPMMPFIAGSFIREIKGNHVWIKRVYTDQTAPSGLIGPVTDAAKLVKAYLNDGKLDGQQILSEQSVFKMTYENYQEETGKEHSCYFRRGIAWEVYKDNNRLILQQKGGGVGFNTVMQIHPENNLGFVLFSNNTDGKASKIIELITTYNW